MMLFCAAAASERWDFWKVQSDLMLWINVTDPGSHRHGMSSYLSPQVFVCPCQRDPTMSSQRLQSKLMRTSCQSECGDELQIPEHHPTHAGSLESN